MRIVFFGSSAFAVSSLERLLNSQHDVQAVVTQPDRKKGRNLKLTATPVKALAESKKIKIFQPQGIADPASIKHLKSFRADLFIVVAFGEILTGSVLEIPRLYSINLHASLLPKYRGAAPINWAIINGEKTTGLSIIRMNEKMDAGDIILQRKIEIEKGDTSETLGGKLADLGAILLLDAIRFIEQDKIEFKKQDEKNITFAPKLKKDDGFIDWTKSAAEIHNKVRGTIPWPGAYTYFNDKKISIWKAQVLDGKANPGEVAEAEKKLIVGTGGGLLQIDKIQIEGKKPMETSDFLRGQRELKKGSGFGV